MFTASPSLQRRQLCRRFACVWVLAALTLSSASKTALGWQNAVPGGSPAPTPASEKADERATPAGSDGRAGSDVDKSPPDLRPCSFQQITPGETRLARVLELLDQPVEELELGRERVLVYRIEPFTKVEILLASDRVTAVVLHLKETASPRQIAQELNLQDLEWAPVTSDTGQIMGRAYPERGVLMNFSEDSKASKVLQLVLEPVSADPFVLRAEHDRRYRYEKNLEDLEIALELEPSHAGALAAQAKILLASDRAAAGLASVEKALQFMPADAHLKLQRAELLARLDRHEEATTLANDVLADRSAGVANHAGAELLLGDVMARGPQRDFRKAIEHHLAAIKMASPLASDRMIAVRRQARQILFDAFLGAAHDIAAGNWQERNATAAKWLASAREIADSITANDGGDKLLKLRLYVSTLESHADMHSDIDPAQLLASIDKEIEQLNEESGDRQFQRALAMKHAQALFHAASIEEGRDARLKAFEYATRAADMIQPVDEGRELTSADRYLVGRLYFFIGSCQAVIHRNHGEAIVWYDKAQKYLNDTLHPSAAVDLGRHGERFVSMGASYWEAGNRDKGLDLTRRGLEMMRQATRRGLLGEDQLALPYGNLAAMYELLGKPEEARGYAETATRLTQPATRRK